MASKNVKGLTFLFGANLKGLDKGLKTAQKKIGKFGKTMKNIGSTMTRSITLPVIGLGAAAIKMASDYEESLNKVRVAFGSSSAEVEKFAKTTSSSFGIAENQALEMAALFGDMGTALGFTTSDAAGMSQQLVGLAGDLASFKNIGVEEAQTALAGIFTGETESLKRLGIMTTEATLKNSEYFLSLGKTWKELSNTEKIQVRYNEVLRQTQNAQGDFARTSGGIANQMRTLQGEFQMVGVQIGNMLMPIALKFFSLIRDGLAWWQGLSKSTKIFLGTMTLLLAALGPAVSLFGTLATVIAAISWPIAAVVAGIVSIVAAFAFVRENYDAFAERLGDWNWWKNALIQVLQWYIEFNPFNMLIEGFNKLMKLLGKKEVENPFTLAIDGLEDMKVKTKEYKHEFSTFADAMKNQSKDLAKGMGLMGNPLGLGGGGGGGGQTDNTAGTFVSSTAPAGPMIGPENATLTEQISLLDQLAGQWGITEKAMDSYAKRLTSSLSRGQESFKEYGEVVKAQIKEVIGGLIAQGVTAAVSSAMKGAVHPLMIPIVAGLASGLAKTAFNSLIPEFAQGGLVTGPTTGLIGEGAGTSPANPEVVAPLDKLQGMIGGGNKNIVVSGILKGNDIFLSNQRTSTNRRRYI